MPLLAEPVRLPGVYFNIFSEFRTMPEGISPGVVIGMIPFPWYLENTPVEIHRREFYDKNYAGKLGFTAFSLDDPHNKKATVLISGTDESIVFPQYTGGAAATGNLGSLQFRAAKLGAAGNTLRLQIVPGDGDFTVITFFGDTPRAVDTQRIQAWADFKLNGYINTQNDTSVPVEAGLVVFSGGSNGALPDFVERLGAFLEQASYLATRWNVIAFSSELSDNNHLQARSAFRNWLDQLNSDIQRKKRGVIGIEFKNGIDNSEITQIDQEIELNNERYTLGEAVLYRASLAAGSLPNHSETNDIMPDMTNVFPLRNTRQRENAILRGVFSYVRNWDGRYKVEDDVNSFVSTRLDKNIQWVSNRVVRTIDTFMERVHRSFNTQFKGHASNNESGRLMFRATIHQICEDFVTFEMMDDHDIEKIHVLPGGGPRTWRVEFRNVIITDAVRDVDVEMGISWSMDVTI